MIDSKMLQICLMGKFLHSSCQYYQGDDGVSEIQVKLKRHTPFAFCLCFKNIVNTDCVASPLV